MKAECSECHKIVNYYQLKSFRLVERIVKNSPLQEQIVTVLMKFICPDCNKSSAGDLREEYSKDEMVTRAKALEVLRAPVVDPRGVAEENKKNNLLVDGIHRS
jgi:hypothetical protein